MPLRELELIGPPPVRRALDGLGRTEDLTFSPSNRRLAIAGFGRDCVFLLDLAIDAGVGAVSVAVRLEGRTILYDSFCVSATPSPLGDTTASSGGGAYTP